MDSLTVNNKKIKKQKKFNTKLLFETKLQFNNKNKETPDQKTKEQSSKKELHKRTQKIKRMKKISKNNSSHHDFEIIKHATTTNLIDRNTDKTESLKCNSEKGKVNNLRNTKFSAQNCTKFSAKKRKQQPVDGQLEAKRKKNLLGKSSKELNLKKDGKHASKTNSVPEIPKNEQIESSCDSEDDEVIRNELKNSSFFKDIQKLLQNNPSFLAGLKEEDLSEEEEISTENEDSSSENDENPSENERVHSENENLHESEEDLPDIRKSDMIRDFRDSVPSTSAVKPIDDGKSKSEYKSGSKMNNYSKGSDISYKDSSMEDVIENNFQEEPNVESSGGFQRSQKKSSTSSTLRNKALEKLQAAKFRYLNEKLYTESGKESFTYFQENKDEFMDYHKGYSLQVAKWPVNPVDKIISSLQKMTGKLIVADMGCGDAKIARTLSNFTIHSFDLVALNEHVVPCNISKVPLSNESVDVVVFCLSLMGTNLKEYLQEAYRIIKFGGMLKIAEVESRVPNLEEFIKSIQSLGFEIEKKDVEHKIFIFLDLKKIKKKKKNASKNKDIQLKPCLYKKR